MFLSFKYRLYPTKAQVNFLTQELTEACSLYNAALEERVSAWKSCSKSISFYDQCNQLPAMKKDGCLTLSNQKLAKDVLRRLDKTFKAFFKRIKKGVKAGFPRFKSRNRYNTLTYPTYGNGCKLLDPNKLRIQGAGHIKLKLHRPIEGKIKTVSITRKASKWYAIFVCEVDPNLLPFSEAEVGIDVGLKSFAVFSNGEVIENQRFTEKAQAKLRVTQRRVARRKKGSNRRKKAITLLQKAWEKVTNKRNDFLHKESRKLVNQFGTIVVEDLNIKGLASGMLAKSVNSVSWGRFFEYIAYKAESAGRRFVKVDSRGTSQTCVCGNLVPKDLSDRWHSCSECGLEADRDLVSSRVILNRGRSVPSVLNVTEVSVSREAEVKI